MFGKKSTRGSSSRPWYAEGLRFTCIQCNQCCTGPPGYVWVDGEEIVRIANFLEMEVRTFFRTYCRQAWSGVSLQERSNGDCVFLTPGGCAIYPVRPLQCRTFPFWDQNLRSRSAWEAVARRCPGVGRGRLYTFEEIERIRLGRGEAAQD